uniref:TPR_REGION domain-containing protein n=1 Tax=Glossina brevipalpis TaxID=37001 RepID=A0A1A9X2J5_9MUSC
MSGAGFEMSGGDDESAESSSSSALGNMPQEFRMALEEFRADWQKEIKQKVEPNETEFSKRDLQRDAHSSSNEVDKENLAQNLYRKAVDLEQKGKVYDAIPYYRRAVQIEPNIEFKYYEYQKLKVQQKGIPEKHTNSSENLHLKKFEDGLETCKDLYEKFQKDLSHNYHGKLIQSNRDVGIISTEMHISDLPPELLLYILRWVISAQLDMRSLEQCSAVCKGLYLCARDEELWRLACVKVWGPNLGTLNPTDLNKTSAATKTVDCHAIIPRYTSWRQMFIERERVLFNGCYISKTTYLRMGENSFQDQYYRPVQLVEYYRYLRFLTDGTVFMMTTADEPAHAVSRLRNVNQNKAEILKGQYRLYGNTLSIVLKKQQQPQLQTKLISASSTLPSTATMLYARQRRSNDDNSISSTKYCLEFRILSTPKRKFAQLMWLHYSIVQTRNKHETASEFDLSSSKYPPLWFSIVRSYHSDADKPLI